MLRGCSTVESLEVASELIFVSDSQARSYFLDGQEGRFHQLFRFVNTQRSIVLGRRHSRFRFEQMAQPRRRETYLTGEFLQRRLPGRADFHE